MTFDIGDSVVCDFPDRNGIMKKIQFVINYKYESPSIDYRGLKMEGGGECRYELIDSRRGNRVVGGYMTAREDGKKIMFNSSILLIENHNKLVVR